MLTSASTLSTADAVPLPRWGRQRGGGSAAKKGSQPRLAALGSPFQGKGLAWILPPSYGRRCPEGAEVGWGKRYEKERRRPSQVRRLRKYPIHRWRGPPSPMGNAFKLSGRTFLAPHRGSCPKGLCKRTGFLGVKRRENPVRRHFERSEMRGLRSGIA